MQRTEKHQKLKNKNINLIGITLLIGTDLTFARGGRGGGGGGRGGGLGLIFGVVIFVAIMISVFKKK